jgi:tetratricopeptide (TPR) repeat protein
MTLSPLIRSVFILAALVAAILILALVVPTIDLPTSPPDPLAHLETARREGRIMQAIYHAEAAALDMGWTPGLLRQTGDLWREAGDLTRAVDYWAAAAALDPANAALLRGLAEAHIELQQWARAAAVLEQLVVLDPDDTFAHLRLALIQAPFNPQSAEEHLRVVVREPAYNEIALPLLAVVTSEPADPLISLRVGLALVEQGLWSYAELAFMHAATVAAPFGEALAYAAFARDNQGKPSADLIAQAVALEPDNARIRYLQGLHYRRLGDDRASIYVLMLAISFDPENPAYYAELGTAYRLAGDLQAAEYWLKTAVIFSNEDPRFQEMLALFYAEESEHLTEEGFGVLTDLVGSLPDDPDVQAGHGWALHTMGESEASLAALDNALAADPENPRALYYKGRVLIDLGRLDEAAALLERVTDSESVFAEQARQALDTLQR